MELHATGPMGEFTSFAHPAGTSSCPAAAGSRAAHVDGAPAVKLALQRDIVFICHFARTPADIIFRAELELMARNLPSFEFVPVLRGRSPEPTLERLQRPCLRARCYG